MAQRRPPKGVDSKGKVRWVARYKDPSGKARSKDFAREKDAKNFEAEMKLAVRKRTWIDPDLQEQTIGELYDRWASRPLRDASTSNYTWTGRELSPELRNIPAILLTAADVDAWYRQLTTGRPWHGDQDTGVSPNTAREHVSRLASAVKMAVTEGILPRNPVKIPKRVDASDGRVRASQLPTEEEVARVIGMLTDGGYRYPRRYRNRAGKVIDTVSTARPSQTLADMVITGMATGLRVSEVCGLTVGDVDFLRRAIRVELQAGKTAGVRVPTKTPRSVRVVPVADDLLLILAEHAEGQSAGAPLFRTRTGKGWTGKTVDESLSRVLRAAGVSWTFHGLRHSYASRLIAGRVSVKTVQETLGHSSAATTLDIYSHLWGDEEDRTRAVVAGVASGARRGTSSGDGQNMGKEWSGEGLHVV